LGSPNSARYWSTVDWIDAIFGPAAEYGGGNELLLVGGHGLVGVSCLRQRETEIHAESKDARD
jgi:hypothetical protein